MAAVNVPQPLPEKDEQTGLSGFYYDQGDRGNQGDVVAGARTVEWFKSKVRFHSSVYVGSKSLIFHNLARN